MFRIIALATFLPLLSACGTTSQTPTTPCLSAVPSDLLQEPIPTTKLPVRDTPLPEVFEDYLTTIRDKEANDARYRSLSRAVRRCM
jgi:hypothetical protein